ncbi:MAG: DUF2512 family protein [Bacillota bacterium]
MKHALALAAKFTFTTLLLAVFLPPFTGVKPLQAMNIAVFVTLINYVLVDLIVLPRAGNVIAVITEGILSIFIIQSAGTYLPAVRGHFLTIVTLAVVLAGIEWFFHKYIRFWVIS